jgi:hypothetical protein
MNATKNNLSALLVKGIGFILNNGGEIWMSVVFILKFVVARGSLGQYLGSL